MMEYLCTTLPLTIQWRPLRIFLVLAEFTDSRFLSLVTATVAYVYRLLIFCLQVSANWGTMDCNLEQFASVYLILPIFSRAITLAVLCQNRTTCWLKNHSKITNSQLLVRYAISYYCQILRSWSSAICFLNRLTYLALIVLVSNNLYQSETVYYWSAGAVT